MAQSTPTPRQRGRKWMARRARLLSDSPLCRACTLAGRLRAATEVDHIVPLYRGGADDDDNLQPLCSDCHRAKSAADMGRLRRIPIGIDGYPADDADQA